MTDSPRDDREWTLGRAIRNGEHHHPTIQGSPWPPVDEPVEVVPKSVLTRVEAELAEARAEREHEQRMRRTEKQRAEKAEAQRESLTTALTGLLNMAEAVTVAVRYMERTCALVDARAALSSLEDT